MQTLKMSLNHPKYILKRHTEIVQFHKPITQTGKTWRNHVRKQIIMHLETDPWNIKQNKIGSIYEGKYMIKCLTRVNSIAQDRPRTTMVLRFRKPCFLLKIICTSYKSTSFLQVIWSKHSPSLLPREKTTLPSMFIVPHVPPVRRSQLASCPLLLQIHFWQ